MTNEEILALYSQWSEEYYCAGFLTPDPLSVQAFRKWLNDPRKLYLKPVEYDYEREMLEEFHRQENSPKSIIRIAHDWYEPETDIFIKSNSEGGDTHG